jgi:hypothetical protein
MKILPALVLFAVSGASLAAGGFGLGVQTALEVAPGSVLVPRFDYLNASDSASYAGPGTIINTNATENLFSLALDYDWFPRGRSDRGFYLLAGLGVAYANVRVSGGSSDGTSASVSKGQTLLYPEVGGGYLFTPHVGLEVVYKAINYKDVYLPIDGTEVAWSNHGELLIAVSLRF